MKKICITLDAEAQPSRSENKHIEKLIWGKFGSREYGINLIMETAEKYGFKIIFFIDYAELFLYGNCLREVTNTIESRGHDAQLHIHAEFIPNSFSKLIGYERTPSLNSIDLEYAKKIFQFFNDIHYEYSGKKFNAFRGGAFRYSKNVLSAMRENEIYLSSNYFPDAKYLSSQLPIMDIFAWENNVLELPLTSIKYNDRRKYCVFEDIDIELFNNFLAESNDISSPINFLLHSWSLLDKDDSGFYTSPSDLKVEKLESFFSSLVDNNFQSMISKDVITCYKNQNLMNIKFEEFFVDTKI